MRLSLFLLFLLLTFATSALLVKRFLLPAKRIVAGIGMLVFWLCLLIGPVQWLALLDLSGLRSFLRVNELFYWSGIAFTGALSLWLSRTGHAPRSKQIEAGSGTRSDIPWHVSAGLVVLACTYGILSLRAAFSFPDAYDSVAYHYPVALRWLQEGTMRITNATNWHGSLPGNAEILDLLVLSTGCDRLLGFVQLPAVFILLLACLQLARRLCESAAPEWPVVTVALMVPMVADQPFTGHVDLFGTALLFGSVTLVLEYCDQAASNTAGAARASPLFAAGLAAGLAVGTKPLFWIFAAVLVFYTYFLLSWHCGRSRAWRRLALFLVAGAVPSVFWFARATACTGNPFYPFAVHFGMLSLPGVSPSDITKPDYYLNSVRHWAELFVYPWIEWKSSRGFLPVNYSPGDGLGGGFATFAMPGIIFAGWLAVRRRPEIRVWLSALGFLLIIWWFLLEKVPRFGLPCFVLTIVLSAPFFEVLELRATRLYRLVYVVVFTFTACLLVFEPLYTMAQTVRSRAWSRAAYLGYPRIIDTLKPGSRVLNLGHETLNFALAGSGLTNRVIPSWERPPRLTKAFLRSWHIDYIVEKLVNRRDDVLVDNEPPAEGFKIVFRDIVKEGENTAEWRIWSVGADFQPLIDSRASVDR